MPNGSMLKYFRDRGGPGSEHGGHLLWPGTLDGFPVRTNTSLPPDLRQDEFEQLSLGYDFQSAEFCLWKAEDKRKFDEVMDRIVNGWYLRYARRDRETPEGFAVWLEWIQIYGEVPTGKTPGAAVNAQLALKPGQPAIQPATPCANVSAEPLGLPAENG